MVVASLPVWPLQELLLNLPAREVLRFKKMAATTVNEGTTSETSLNHEYIDFAVAHTVEVRDAPLGSKAAWEGPGSPVPAGAQGRARTPTHGGLPRWLWPCHRCNEVVVGVFPRSLLCWPVQRIQAQMEGRWVATPPSDHSGAAPARRREAAPNFDFLLGQFDRQVEAAKKIQVRRPGGAARFPARQRRRTRLRLDEG